MNGMLNAIKKIYGEIIKLFPHEFQDESGEELLGIFSAMVNEAARKGKLALVTVCLQEMRDFPVLLAWEHLERMTMNRIFRLQPVQSVLRGIAVFSVGLAFAGVFIANLSHQPLIFGVQNGSPYWKYMLPGLRGYLLAAVVGGMIFELAFGNHRHPGWYALVGTLGWFLPLATLYTLTFAFWNIMLNGIQQITLSIAEMILEGACLGLMFSVARSGRRLYLWLLLGAILIFPSLAYSIPLLLLHTRLLTTLSISHSPWFFTAVFTLVVIFIACIIFMGIKIEGDMPWLVILGAVGYAILAYANENIISFLYLHLALPKYYYDPFHIAYVIKVGIAGITLGILFGIAVGLILAWQERNSRQVRI
jgi:hypothetical protein